MIDARHLTLHRLGVCVLRDVSLALQPGTITGLVGPPGAGKSTLLKALAGLLPCAGDVEENGIPQTLQTTAWRARVGFAFQNNALFDHLNVFENVAFALRQRGMADAAVCLRVQERLRQVELWEARHLLPFALSGGMRKRVGIARACAIDATLGLFDDPTAGLDPQTAWQILTVLKLLTVQGNLHTCIVGSDLTLLLPMCDQIAMLVQGEAVFCGTPAQMLRHGDPRVVQFTQGLVEGPL